jgi:hypothetical protein
VLPWPRVEYCSMLWCLRLQPQTRDFIEESCPQKRPRPDRFVLLVVFALGAWAGAQEDHPSAFKIKKHIYDSDYDSWTEPYREMPLLSYLYDPEKRIGHTDAAMLKVVIVEGDDEPAKQRPGTYGDPMALYGSSVSIQGRPCGFSYTAFGIRGGGDLLLSDDVVKQLKELAANLPDDHKQLPSKGLRVVVETMYTPKVQVYDRASLPHAITTILRLTGTTLHPLPAKRKPDDAENTQ